LAARVLRFDAAKETDRIISFVREVVTEASAKGAVVGLSGGVDSAVVGILCVRALGKDKVLGLFMPSYHTPKQDMEDARFLAEAWGIRAESIPISSIAEAISGLARVGGTKLARANVEARVRMSILYYHANSLGYLVAGTGDRSESLLGYFTKWGDGGVDFLPIAHLYKSQVRELAEYLGLPPGVARKPASPQLWPGHKASDEIPADYDKLDIVLRCLFDLRANPAKAAKEARVPMDVVNRVLEMHRKTQHKRTMPPSLT